MASLTYWDGTRERPINYIHKPGVPDVRYQKIVVVPWGYSSVAEMMKQPEFQIAHRGGSQDFPEHSLFAYTQSVLHGAKALELSLARTSDGVWFGNHDLTLLRTTGDSRDPSTLTWAQVQAINIKGDLNGQSWPSQPHATFHQIMAAYGQSHVWFMDPKYEHSRNRTAFFDLLATVPNSTSRFVIKYFHDNVSLAQAARARGYKTWGYYYNDALTADPTLIDQTGANWDFLGIDYTASAANWAKIKSYGKPVIGHIVPDASGATLTRSRGANGIMASGITKVIPRIDNIVNLTYETA